MKDIVELIDMEVTADDLRHGVEDEHGVLYSEDGLYLMECRNKELKSYTVKEGCMIICEKAFFHTMFIGGKLEEVILPEGVVAIGGAAFMGCRNLRSITLPESLRYIGESAFEYCKSLKHLTLPSGLTAMGGNPLVDSGVRQIHSRSSRFHVTDGCLMQGDKMVAWLSSKNRCVVPEGTRILGDEAFPSEMHMHEIILPESLEEIGNNAFQGGVLQRLVIPRNVRKMGDNPFAACQIKVLDIQSPHFTFKDGFLVSDKGVLVAYMGAASEVTVPEMVREIGAGAFYDNGIVEHIVLPSSLETIRHNAFANCCCLNKLDIPEGVDKIDDGAFTGCTALHSLNLPKGLRLVSDYLFADSGIEEVTIPEGVEHIGKSAFAYCQQLHTVRIPSSVKTIGKCAFTGCDKLTDADVSCMDVQLGVTWCKNKLKDNTGSALQPWESGKVKTKTEEIKYFHPSGKPLPNGSHFQRGGFLHKCRVNKDAFTLQFHHLEGPVGLCAQGGRDCLSRGCGVAGLPGRNAHPSGEDPRLFRRTCLPWTLCRFPWPKVRRGIPDGRIGRNFF